MKSIEATGKTVKDAIRNGLAELGCDSDDVDIQVVEMGSPGLFGMFGKPAKVRLTVKAEDPALDIEMPVLSLDAGAKKQKSDKRKAEKPRAEKPAKAEAVETEAAEEIASEDAPKEKKSRNRRRRRGGARSEGEAVEASEGEEQSIAEPAPVIEHEPFVATAEADQSDDAKKAAAFLAGLTDRMGVPVSIELMETPEQLRMQMAGENMSLLIGRRGETLDALQYLTSLPSTPRTTAPSARRPCGSWPCAWRAAPRRAAAAWRWSP